MARVWLLTRVLLKSVGQESKKPMRLFLIFVLALIGIVPLGFMFGFLFKLMFEVVAPLNQQVFILGIILNLGMMVTFIFAFFTIPALYYYGNDIESILPLPFKPSEIILAKFLTAMIYEYAVVALFFLPAMIAYGIVFGLNLAWGVALVVGALFFPIMPVIYASILVMIIMRFSKIFANKERFGLIAGLLGLAIGIGFNLFSQSAFQGNANSMIDLIQSNQSLLSMISTIFPLSIFLSKLVEGGWIYLLWIILIHVAALWIMLIVSQAIYFDGVLNVSGSNSKKQKLTNEQLVFKSQKGSILKSIIMKEFRDMTRSSIYFMNLLVISFLMPVLLLIPFFASGNPGELSLLVGSINFGHPMIVNGIIIASFAIGIFLAGTNNIASTAVTREGQNFFVMKMIPVSYKIQLLGKMIPGMIVGAMACILSFGVIGILLTIPVHIVLLAIAFSILGALTVSNINLWIGCIKPKLDWTTEAQAVKQSVVALVGILLSMALGGAMILLFFILDQSLIIIVGIVLLIATVFSLLGWTLANKAFNRFASNY